MIWEAIRLLGVERIDHGVRCEEDPVLVDYLREHAIPLTVCPLSNVRLKVFDRLPAHNLGRLLDAGLAVTINSDDPAYFGGYIGDNFRACARDLPLDARAVVRCVRNSALGAFLPDAAKRGWVDKIDTIAAEFDVSNGR